jgi:hypothetical protein
MLRARSNSNLIVKALAMNAAERGCHISHLLLLTSAFLLLLLSLAHAKYSGGAGTPEDPYRIADHNDLYALADDINDYNKCFVMTADIDLDPTLPGRRQLTTALIAPDINEGSVFDGTPFTGTFDGNHCNIRNLTIDASGLGNDYLALFGEIGRDAVVSNLGVSEANITGSLDGSYYLGGLTGHNYFGSVTNCYETGAVAGGGSVVGGLVGWNDTGGVTDCHATGAVTGDDYVGGLVGWNNQGSVAGCHATGPVTGHGYNVGGLVGAGLHALINKCCATGEVNGSFGNIGGLVGDIFGGSVTNCYATGEVNGSSNNVGGLVGYGEYLDVTNCYATGAVQGAGVVGGLLGYNWGAIVTNSYATGEVTGNQYVGGLTGHNYLGSISNCYATGPVTGDSTVGGLVGWNDAGGVTDCYATGAVTGNDYVGGLVGRGDIGGTFMSFFRLDPAYGGGPDNGIGWPLTDIEMKQQVSFAYWDFADAWAICEGTNYPRLQWSIPPADMLCPDGVTMLDYSYLADRWLWTDCGDCEGADLTSDGRIDHHDLKTFSTQYLSAL